MELASRTLMFSSREKRRTPPTSKLMDPKVAKTPQGSLRDIPVQQATSRSRPNLNLPIDNKRR